MQRATCKQRSGERSPSGPTSFSTFTPAAALLTYDALLRSVQVPAEAGAEPKSSLGQEGLTLGSDLLLERERQAFRDCAA
jgi:hypothetical protein